MREGGGVKEERGDVVVVGAGAAGLMAAIFAAEGERRVVVLERTRDGGKKILISGGGRCNVLPSELSPARYVTESSPNTLKKMLLSWPLEEQRRFFEEDLRLPLALETETGKLFPASNRAADVRDGLVSLARSRGVRLEFGAEVAELAPAASGWRVGLRGGGGLDAAAVVLASGGLSVPKTGSDGAGLRLARELGHTIHPTYPALTPLTADPPRHAALAGISREVTISATLARGAFSTHGGFLFTHRGYSGPAVLNVSHLAVRSEAGARQPILVQWTELVAAGWETALRASTGTVGSVVRRPLPDRLADQLIAEAGVDPQRPLAQLRRDERARLVEVLARYPLPWTGDEGYRKAEVTGGGVALSEVHPVTLESRIRPGLFLCGEILDAFGPIGGYNFAWAWATGRAAGRAAGHR
jgi:predicted Rossmann fold flavoprotein